MLCIRRTLIDGRKAGIVSGLGAACADTIYGFIAAIGSTFASQLIDSHPAWLRLTGSLLLIGLGMHMLLSRPPEARREPRTGLGLAADFTTTFLITLTNPMTVIAFGVAFAALGLADSAGGVMHSGILVGGVFLGSALWWIVLCASVSRVRKQINPARLKLVNTVGGVLILAIGVYALVGFALTQYRPADTGTPVSETSEQ